MNTPVSGAPRVLLRAEGLAVLIGALLGFAALGGSWGSSPSPFSRLISRSWLTWPGRAPAPWPTTRFTPIWALAALAALAYLGVVPTAWPLCLIWMAHIGLDRPLGLGLKFPSAFGHTHLGPAPTT